MATIRLLLFVTIFAFYVKNTMTDNVDISLDEMQISLSSSIWAPDGNDGWIELTTLSSTENRVWVSYDDIPQDFKDAIVAIEDKRFYTHKGVDWYRTSGALFYMFLKMDNNFGGSTLTQQLIKNLTGNDEVTVSRKLSEIFMALDFEKQYTKEEIIEGYLNVVYFGEGCYGISTAAQKYFGKEVSELSLAECASIAGITNAPTQYDPFINTEQNKKRQETILSEMYNQGFISYDEYEAAVKEELNFVRGEGDTYVQDIYSYYEETVLSDVISDLAKQRGINYNTASYLVYHGGYQIYCCLDQRIQDIVDSVYENVDSLPQPYYASNQQLQSAIVIMDPYTGKIVALSGGVGEKTINLGTNRATVSQRPCGSSTKPLSVYGPALEYGLITQNTLVNDAPDIILNGTSWYPKNAGGGNSGILTIRTALARSLNTVAAQIMDKLTPAASYDYMVNRLGFSTLVEDDCNYAPLALGQYTNGVTVRDMTQAYCSFVNEGIMTRSRTYTLVTDSKGNTVIDNQPVTNQAFSANTAANICDMLNNAANNGTGRGSAISQTPVAGKTGTTSDNHDRYFAGFTEYYVACVWTGYDIPANMYFNDNPAVVIWNRIMEQVHEGLPYKAFPTPVVGGDTGIFDLTEEEEEPEPTDEPEETEEPEPSPSPTPEATPEPSPIQTETPAATAEPAPSPTPVPTEAPQPTEEVPATQAPEIEPIPPETAPPVQEGTVE